MLIPFKIWSPYEHYLYIYIFYRNEICGLKMELEPLNKYEAAILPDKNKLNNSKEVKRDTWGNRVEFLLAIVGYTVGIGSVWRFPILCARNGGGAFLIPFFFFLLTCGGPLYYIEVCLGQFSGKSAAAAFEFCPLFKGTPVVINLPSFNTPMHRKK